MKRETAKRIRHARRVRTALTAMSLLCSVFTALAIIAFACSVLCLAHGNIKALPAMAVGTFIIWAASEFNETIERRLKK